jgi:nicotinate-nucleotide adenylyltransferase
MRHPDDPVAAPGQVVGLFGGSFDPPHAGHDALAREALRRLDLDRLWWLVSPGNPLKPHPPAPIAARIAAARARLHDPRITVTGIEARLGTRATADTLAALRRRYPRVRFVWLMGADNLATFHRWDRWRAILESVPVAVFARPGLRLAALTSPAARAFARARRDPRAARDLGRQRPPAWVWFDMPMHRISSTELRRSRS